MRSRLYPDLEHNLEDAGATFVAREPLIAGPSIVETVFEGPHVALDQGVRTKLTLTWWEFQPPRPVARVAELSYKVKTTDGDLSRDAARHVCGSSSGCRPAYRRLPRPRAPEQDRPRLVRASGGARLEGVLVLSHLWTYMGPRLTLPTVRLELVLAEDENQSLEVQPGCPVAARHRATRRERRRGSA